MVSKSSRRKWDERSWCIRITFYLNHLRGSSTSGKPGRHWSSPKTTFKNFRQIFRTKRMERTVLTRMSWCPLRPRLSLVRKINQRINVLTKSWGEGTRLFLMLILIKHRSRLKMIRTKIHLDPKLLTPKINAPVPSPTPNLSTTKTLSKMILTPQMFGPETLSTSKNPWFPQNCRSKTFNIKTQKMPNNHFCY